MTPIFFPFTYVTELFAKPMYSCFGKARLYQPSLIDLPEKLRKCVSDGLLNIYVPIEGDKKQLDLLLADYICWANSHSGSEISFFKTMGDSIFNYDKSYVSQIRSDILKKSLKNISDDKLEEKDFITFSAQLFLHIAQDFDIKKWDIHQSLSLIEKKKRVLFNGLNGKNGRSIDKSIKHSELIHNDLLDFMICERISAWNYVMQHDKNISPFFITNSRLIFEHLIDKAPKGEMLYKLNIFSEAENNRKNVSTCMDPLMLNLEAIAKKPWPSEVAGFEQSFISGISNSKIKLSVYIVPDETPDIFFNRASKFKFGQAEMHNFNSSFINTILALIEIAN